MIDLNVLHKNKLLGKENYSSVPYIFGLYMRVI
jgi:hypothetical protein